MNFGNLNRSVALLANVGVLAGIIFLAIEIRQNNQLLTAEARQVALQNRSLTLERWAGDRELMALRLKATNNESLTTDELWRIESDFTALISRFEYDYDQYQAGLIPYLPMSGWKSIFARWPYMVALWGSQSDRFSMEFVQFVNMEILD